MFRTAIQISVRFCIHLYSKKFVSRRIVAVIGYIKSRLESTVSRDVSIQSQLLAGIDYLPNRIRLSSFQSVVFDINYLKADIVLYIHMHAIHNCFQLFIFTNLFM